MTKIIGVMPLYDDEKESVWMLPGYLDGIRQAGATPIVFPQIANTEEIQMLVALCDGFLMTGGHDVDPAIYKEEKKDTCGIVNHERDQLEREVFRMAYEQNKPVLGICRGLQMINALLGGTLYQDLSSEFSQELNHVMTAPYDKTQHNVFVEKKSPLFGLIHTEILGVNSYHHQGVKELADDLAVMARATDGLIEAAYSKSKDFVWAVQWHPEFSFKKDSTSQKIFAAFVNACGMEHYKMAKIS